MRLLAPAWKEYSRAFQEGTFTCASFAGPYMMLIVKPVALLWSGRTHVISLWKGREITSRGGLAWLKLMGYLARLNEPGFVIYLCTLFSIISMQWGFVFISRKSSNGPVCNKVSMTEADKFFLLFLMRDRSSLSQNLEVFQHTSM